MAALLVKAVEAETVRAIRALEPFAADQRLVTLANAHDIMVDAIRSRTTPPAGKEGRDD